eukprot:NODE_3589_length_940_cov_13.912669_g3437_i0.p1 GENE.NODE_3589_length_940_cov_13.912669_g3437_i0~~NODE_3589_length_940_cov_13.912669_g3437_i0.p1  ORF type:complete len:302 (+),score=54.68 NODE_3589_length_940_cov_13.912669_g3437_i0:33-908(+)
MHRALRLLGLFGGTFKANTPKPQLPPNLSKAKATEYAKKNAIQFNQRRLKKVPQDPDHAVQDISVVPHLEVPASPPAYPQSFDFLATTPYNVASPLYCRVRQATPPPSWYPRHLASQLASLGVHFTNHALMVQAFTHSSFDPTNTPHSQHRASLHAIAPVGRAGLQLFLRSWLWQAWPGRAATEYDLLVASATATEVLAQRCQQLQLDALTLTLEENGSAGPVSKQTPSDPQDCAEQFEAFVGAIYLDSGLAAQAEFLRCHYAPHLPQTLPKSVFQKLKSFWKKAPVPEEE